MVGKEASEDAGGPWAGKTSLAGATGWMWGPSPTWRASEGEHCPGFLTDLTGFLWSSSQVNERDETPEVNLMHIWSIDC